MKTTPIKAIRKKCLQCCAGSYKEVRECIITDCPLYVYRFGKRPGREAKKQMDSETDWHIDLKGIERF